MGAGTAVQALLRALRRDATADGTPVGVLDDEAFYGVCGPSVLGGTDAIGKTAMRTGARAALLAIPSPPRPRAADLIERSLTAGLAVPALSPGDRTVQDPSDVRPAVMGREEIAIGGDRARRLVAGRRVLVTGAGGAVGAALCRRLTELEPAALCLLDQDAAALDRLGTEIGGTGRVAPERTVIAHVDVRDGDAIAAVFDEVRPQIVFHAAQCGERAALERDPCAGVLTNVRGTQHVVEAALRGGVDRLALVSTDAAADPASVFGATKRLAELVPQAYAGGATCFAAVRIGEVLGAPGSLLSALAGRITRNEVITIAHPDLARRFMTGAESAGLVLEAAALAETAETFALDVGRPVPVVDLVHRYAEQLRVPAVYIRFGAFGPGERLAERAFSTAERPLPTAHPNVLATGPSPVPAALPRLLESLYLTAACGDEETTRVMLRRLLPEYRPSSRP